MWPYPIQVFFCSCVIGCFGQWVIHEWVVTTVFNLDEFLGWLFPSIAVHVSRALTSLVVTKSFPATMFCEESGCAYVRISESVHCVSECIACPPPFLLIPNGGTYWAGGVCLSRSYPSIHLTPWLTDSDSSELGKGTIRANAGKRVSKHQNPSLLALCCGLRASQYPTFLYHRLPFR